MTKEDYLDLIRVSEAVMLLEEGCQIITGHGLEEGDCTDIFRVWEILNRNASVDYQRFIDVLENKELSSEEKYELLMN